MPAQSKLHAMPPNRIEAPSKMRTLRFQCPNTGCMADSCIVIIRARCPICEELHEWQVADTGLGTVLSADHHPKGTRLTKAQNAPRDFQGPSTEIIELREQLLDDFNHRLKNNLQILYALLQAAFRKTGNAEAREVLSDTSRRIAAMGTAQQVFYSVRSSTDVSGQIFLEAVCANARLFFSKDVSIRYEATGSLPKETAMPLALVLNELLTNAAKHGADDRGRVTINVGLSQRSGSHELYVQDCGSGFNFEEAEGRSSGLGLVTVLAQRLKGSFTVERRSGARCILRFPDR
jgi:two-component sensor histidine kinase